MAGPTITLTFAGDTQKLDGAVRRAGSSVDAFGTSVKKSGDRAGAGFDRLRDGADDADTKAMGFRDTITGFQDTFKGVTDNSMNLGDRLLTLGMGIGDLASGMANFLIPMLGKLVTGFIPAITAAWGFTAALLANPITWIVLGIAALIAIIVLLVKNWDKVKEVWEIVVKFLRDKWNDFTDWFKGIVSDIGKFFSDAWNKAFGVVKGYFDAHIQLVRGLKDRVLDVFSAIGNGIKNAFSSAFGAIKGLWNNTAGRIGFSIPSWVPGLGGKSFHMPTFHRGGVVPGRPGTEVMALLQAGERVSPIGRDSGGSSVTINFSGDTNGAFATAFMNLVRTGAIQIQAA